MARTHGTCACGAPLVEFYDRAGFLDDGDDNGIRCASCGLEDDAAELLAALRAGEPDARGCLEAWTPRCDIAQSIIGRLIGEAQDCARRGDLDEAMHRLRLAAEPKFESRADCEAAYAAAMGRAVPETGAPA